MKRDWIAIGVFIGYFAGSATVYFSEGVYKEKIAKYECEKHQPRTIECEMVFVPVYKEAE